MDVKTANLKFKNNISKRKSTAKIILHHAAASGATVQQIHQWHLANGWAGIGYHFYIRKNGEIWQGRSIDTVGAHCCGENSDSIGICFEGNFESEEVGDIQINSGKELISYILGKYPKLKIFGHKDFNATACPGRNFPLEEFSERTDHMTNLKKGSKGTDVKILQVLLNLEGASLETDGDFGALTDAALRQFQSERGLASDGIAGQATWQALSEVKPDSEITVLKTKIANAQKALA